MSDAELTADDLVKAEIDAQAEVEKALITMRNIKIGRIEQATREIPIKYARINAHEDHIKLLKRDRAYFTAQVRVIDARLTEINKAWGLS